MDLMTGMKPFSKGPHQLSVINTDLVEAESLIKIMSREERKRDPFAFAGKEACVYFKMRYVPPCDPFKEIRRLILRIHENTGLRANFKGVVAIEVSEWIGHEREEHFSVLLKYLYDHRSLWRIAVVLNDRTEKQIDRFMSCCTRYITPRLFDVKLFSDRESLCGMIRHGFAQRGFDITQKASGLMAEAMARSELKDARSLTLIERSVEEVISLAENCKSVTADIIRDYLMDPYSTLTMIAGKPLLDERSMKSGKEALHL